MKIGFLSKSVGRDAGGLLPVMQRLGEELHSITGTAISAVGVGGGSLDEEMRNWSSTQVNTYNTFGPKLLGYAPSLASGLDSLNLDILHCHGLFHYTSVVSTLWGRNHGGYVVSPHGMLDPWALNNSRLKKKIAALLFEKRHLMNAGCIHSLCESETRSIRKYGISAPICQIPNGIDIPPSMAVTTSPWSGTIADGKKVLLFLSRIHPKKGLANLIRAWSAAYTEASSAKDWTLVIVGWDQGGHQLELQKLVLELRVEQTVLFLGPQFDDAKSIVYRASDAFVLPSVSEGLPMVVLEAWAYGLPALITDSCNLEEGYSAGAALRIEPDPTSICNGLHTLFSMTDKEREAVGQKGFNLVQAKFTWKKVATDMLGVYEWLLGGGATPESIIS